MAVAGDMGFLSLAYLMEVSVVLNLAYREFKLPYLDDRLKEEASKVMSYFDKNGLKKEITRYSSESGMFPEYEELEFFLGDDRTLEKNRAKSKLWSSDGKHIKFVKKHTAEKRSLKVINGFIYANIAILIIITMFSHVSIQPSEGFETITNVLVNTISSNAQASKGLSTNSSIDGNAFALISWVVMFILLIIMILTPLYFINRGSACEEKLFGKKSTIKLRKKAIRKKLDDINGEDIDSFSV